MNKLIFFHSHVNVNPPPISFLPGAYGSIPLGHTSSNAFFVYCPIRGLGEKPSPLGAV